MWHLFCIYVTCSQVTGLNFPRNNAASGRTGTKSDNRTGGVRPSFDDSDAQFRTRSLEKAGCPYPTGLTGMRGNDGSGIECGGYRDGHGLPGYDDGDEALEPEGWMVEALSLV